MMSFQPINLKSIIPLIEGYHYYLTSIFITLPLGSRFHIKGPLNIIQDHASLIHSRLRYFNILSQDITYSTFIHVLRKGHKSIKTRHNILHFNSYYMSFQKRTGIDIIMYKSSYTPSYHHQYDHHRLIQSIRNNHASTLRLYTQSQSHSLT